MNYSPMYKKQNPFHLNFFSLFIYLIIITMISSILFLIGPDISFADFEYDFGWIPPDPNVENALIEEGKADIKITPYLPSRYIKPKQDMEIYSQVLEQSGPSCVAFAVTSLMEYLYGRQYASTSKGTIRFSPIDLFCTCKIIEIDKNLFSQGDPTQGIPNYLAIQYALREYGIYPENCYQSCYPECKINPEDLCAVDNYNACNTRCGTRITSRGYNFIDSTPYPEKLDILKSCLYNNRPFIAAIPVFRNWNDMLENRDTTGDVPDPVNPDDPNYIVGGHTVCFVGYKDVKDDPNWSGGGYFWFKNSWGTGWGYDGYGRISYDYMLMYSREIVVLDESEIIWSKYILVDDCYDYCVDDNNPPEIKGLIFDSSTISLIVDNKLTFSVVATDKDVNDNLTYSLRDSSPKGATIDTNTGKIEWTPTNTGDYNFTITVTDRCNEFVDKTIEIKIQDCNSCCKYKSCSSCCPITGGSLYGGFIGGTTYGGFIGGTTYGGFIGVTPFGGFAGGTTYGGFMGVTPYGGFVGGTTYGGYKGGNTTTVFTWPL